MTLERQDHQAFVSRIASPYQSMMPRTIEGGVHAWRFIDADKMMRFTPGPMRAQAGKSYHVDGPISIGRNGLRGSPSVLDALDPARAAWLCRTYHYGVVVYLERMHGDILASSDCGVLWLVDASEILHEFGLWCASEPSLYRTGIPDARSRRAMVLKRRWLEGTATSDELADARNAARLALLDPDGTLAPCQAARESAVDAARSAAWEAAEERFSRGSAAWVIARNEQKAMLERLALALAPTGESNGHVMEDSSAKE
jgi:hypothetical protein